MACATPYCPEVSDLAGWFDSYGHTIVVFTCAEGPMPHIALREDLFGITSLLDYRPQTAAPLCALTQVMLRGPSSLTEAERELIATYVSQRNECTFCATAHGSATCHSVGGDITQVEGVRADLASAPVSDKMRALLQIAGKVQQNGNVMQQSDADAARAAGATDIEIHDTVLIAALFCLYNRYVDGLATRTPTDPAYYDALGARITSRGYTMPPTGYRPLVDAPRRDASGDECDPKSMHASQQVAGER